MTPRERIAAECDRLGTSAVVAGCVQLLAGRDVADSFVLAVGGAHGRHLLETGPRPDQRYWLRVWAARALLYAWDDTARTSVTSALADDSWRVREMAAKVVVRRRIGDALQIVAELRQDPVERVRVAASRATAVLTAERL